MKEGSGQESLLTPDEVAGGRELLMRVRDGLGKVILGQTELLDLTIIAIAARGHVLLEGLPGLGKTELVKGMSRLLDLSFRRVQFTPDMLPSDITGGPILQEENGKRTFVFEPGPLFANLVLADEINRASPKTQSALLEAMQEQRVTVLGETHRLPSPFFVLATQNPIELEGTYPLPEAQLDRFLFKIDVPAVGADVLATIIKNRRRGEPPEIEAVLDADSIQQLFAIVDRIFLPDAVADYIARLVTASHPEDPSCPESLRSWVRYGASPRAAIGLAEASRASALLAGRPNVDFDDVARVATATLAHRILLDHAARLEGVSNHDVVRHLLEGVDQVGTPLPEELR